MKKMFLVLAISLSAASLSATNGLHHGRRNISTLAQIVRDPCTFISAIAAVSFWGFWQALKLLEQNRYSGIRAGGLRYR
ncbi:hypothetical protein HOK96_04015 [bacterium]|jgi:hypothetical protein|nr:hypothetical protein [bacterium]MBT3903879.1 hypothetical protein [bacterium]MBT4578094.1 hypothetical protein [bacterium]MBT5346185.1 hypothetical protein [bacterium]MBT6130981.1 hypothetical protein [bacterium]